MEKRILIAPSILAADKTKLPSEVRLIESLGADYVHFDVMDGKFVPNTSYTVKDLLLIKDHHHLINDVHIMVIDPLNEGVKFAKSGAHIVTFHYEACKNDKEIINVINAIRANGAKVGISIKPNTPVDAILSYLKYIDMVLVMSVEPGKGGQKFIESSLNKISTLRKYIDDNQLNVLIEVDGGINFETAKACKEAGADILVAGSYLFGHEDIKERIEGLR